MSKDIKELLNFIDEFEWFSSKYKNSDIKDFRRILINTIEERNMMAHSRNHFENYVDKSSRKNYLVGVLPKFFQDKDLFDKNSDLADFAGCIGVYIPRYDKKSRYEIIGYIICSISEMDERHVGMFVDAIDKIVTDDRLIANLKNYKNTSGSSYDWNELIRELSKF